LRADPNERYEPGDTKSLVFNSAQQGRQAASSKDPDAHSTELNRLESRHTAGLLSQWADVCMGREEGTRAATAPPASLESWSTTIALFRTLPLENYRTQSNQYSECVRTLIDRPVSSAKGSKCTAIARNKRRMSSVQSNPSLALHHTCRPEARGARG
jgi:hypothetical protein